MVEVIKVIYLTNNLFDNKEARSVLLLLSISFIRWQFIGHGLTAKSIYDS